MTRRLSTLQIALLLSVAVHAALLAMRFADPQAFKRVLEDSPLEVILVNARSAGPPVQAQAIAQVNLAGGGRALAGLATSPLPATAQVELGDASEDSQRHIEALQQTQQRLLAQIRDELARLPRPDPQQDEGSPQAQALQERRRQLVDWLAQIERRISEENQRPERRFVSPATRQAEYAQYYDRWRQRVEERGTRDFPQHRGHKLYGELTMNITVDARGRVVDVEVVRPSKSRMLDRRAVAIVRAAAPFDPFSAEMQRQADELVITSRFRFTRDEALEATVSAQP